MGRTEADWARMDAEAEGLKKLNDLLQQTLNIQKETIAIALNSIETQQKTVLLLQQRLDKYEKAASHD